MRMFAAANNIANMNTEPPVGLDEVVSSADAGGGVSSMLVGRESAFGADLVTEAVNMKMAALSFEANAKAISAADQALGSLVDMMDRASEPV